MNRRDLLHASGVSTVVFALADLMPELIAAPSEGQNPSDKPYMQLTRISDPDVVANVYDSGGRGLESSTSPYVYAFFDEQTGAFKDPRNLQPTLENKPLTIESTLHSFNIRTTNEKDFKNLQNKVQLGFNATVSTPDNSDKLKWVFMNAIDVFLSKNTKKPDQLTPLNGSNSAGAMLAAKPKISTSNGRVLLQVTAFGQKKNGILGTIFDAIAKVIGSPIVSTASKGFGLPSLATEAVNFVDQAWEQLAKQDKSVQLWSTGSLEFGVTKDALDKAKTRFKMVPGLWAIVDSDYAQDTKFLEGHTIDTQYQNFLIKNKEGKAADANYLVTEITIG